MSVLTPSPMRYVCFFKSNQIKTKWNLSKQVDCVFDEIEQNLMNLIHKNVNNRP